MKMLVLGAGGIGGYFGGRLAQAGVDVTFLVRPRRREQLARDGLRIRSPLGDAELPVKTVLATELGPGYDFVLLTCKAYDLDSALDAIAPAMDGHCAVVPMLNGMAHLARLDERFGAANVMGGACSISVTLEKDGAIRHADPLQRIAFGERDRSRSPRVRMLADAFAATTIEWELADDIEQNMWEKISFLSVLASVNCLFRGNLGEIIAAPGGLAAIERALAVNFEIAARNGHPPRAPAIEFGRKTLTDPASKRSASMLHDLEAGLPVESDHVVGWMLEQARAHKLDDTVLSLAYTHLKTYEARRDAGRLPRRES
ncbi:MAG TPA: 2-dehydropantoate 2-reductase [Gemmatimonadaceae bacterium]